MKNTRKLKYFLMLLFFDICAKKYKNKNEIGNRMKEARMCQRDVMLCVTFYRQQYLTWDEKQLFCCLAFYFRNFCAYLKAKKLLKQ